jgi:signal transduction histidine kinase
MKASPRQTALEVAIVTLVLMALVYADPTPSPSPWYFQWSSALLWVSIQLIAVNAILRRGRQRAHETRVTIGAAYVTVAVVGATNNAAALVVAKLVLDIPTISKDIYDAVRRGAINGLLILGLWSLLYVLPRMVQEARDRERKRYEQQRDADRTRIKATLEPHFVLNTLNTIAGLVGNHPDRARELIGDLGDLLRDVVRNSERTRHAAADEIAWLERYAHLLEARHPGQLSVRLQLAADARDIAIPIMLLQPVLENAIHHGALQGDGHVEVDVRLVDGMLQCTIDDDGPGLSPQPIRDDARGIELVRQRLALDAPGGSFELASRDRGARATLLLPVGR